MRRVYIVFYWLFKSRNNVSLSELLKFLFKGRVKQNGGRFIKSISEGGSSYQVSWETMPYNLYWPKLYSIDGIYQVAAETFDPSDFHYYQKIVPIKESEVLLDIGAAEGLFALSVIDKCKKVILVEPNVNFVDSLNKTFASFGSKVEILNYAVGEESGTVKFNNNSLSGGISNDGEGSVEVPIRKIDDIIPSDIKVSFFKADIEGFEFNMLKGAKETIKKNRPTIAITTYHKENEEDQIIELIKSFVPEYHVFKNGIIHAGGKAVMVHFWIDS